MASTVDTLTFDCADARRMVDFWSAALGYELDDIDDEGAYLVDPGGRGWALFFQIVPEGKSVKTVCTWTFVRRARWPGRSSA